MAGPGEGFKPAATHYEVLGLTPAILDSQHDPSTLTKQAYRRALLRHHPDKSSSSLQQQPQVYTVDQITRAFTVISSSRQRADYDAGLRVSRAAGGDDDDDARRFQTGVENIDLDDLAFDEADGRWYRPCRCGNDCGYSFREDDLEEVEHDGVLMVGCQDCSLWLKVHFAVVEDVQSETETTTRSS